MSGVDRFEIQVIRAIAGLGQIAILITYAAITRKLMKIYIFMKTISENVFNNCRE